MNRREFLLGSSSLASLSLWLPASSWATGADGNTELSGQLALNRSFDLGASDSDNVSNYSKPPLTITVDSGIRVGSKIDVEVDGSNYLTHSLTAEDYNSQGFSASMPELADGTHVFTGTIAYGSNIDRLTGFTYGLDRSISKPTLRGDARSSNARPSFNVEFGNNPPERGDTLVLRIAARGSERLVSAEKTLDVGDLRTTAITASIALARGYHTAECYVYRPTDLKFSAVSDGFDQVIVPPASIATNKGQQFVFTSSNVTTAMKKEIAILANSVVVIGLFAMAASPKRALLDFRIHVPSGNPIGVPLLPAITEANRTDGGRQYNYVGLFAYNNSATNNTSCDLVATWNGNTGADGIDCAGFQIWSMIGTKNATAFSTGSATKQLPNTDTKIDVPAGGAVFSLATQEYGGSRVTWTSTPPINPLNTMNQLVQGTNGNGFAMSATSSDIPVAVRGQSIGYANANGSSLALVAASFGPE